MYTLRLFKEKNTIARDHIYLGDSYSTCEPSEDDVKNDIKMRVVGNWDSTTSKGIAIYKTDHAFIMTQLGGTFEILNRPS